MPCYISRRFLIKYKARKIYTHLIQFFDLFELCHAANFYPHEETVFSLFTNEANAIAGFFSFMKFSPIRKPRKPCCLNKLIFSTELIPLSATLILSDGIFSAILKLLPISTSNVFRLRL